MLLRIVISVRCETSAEQLRFLLAKLREMLLAHPRILAESARVRLTGFGVSSRDVELFGYARTGDWALSKVRNGKSRVSEVFEHKEKEQSVETEV